MSPSIPDDVRHFLAEHRYGTIASLDPDGTPHQAVVWYLVEDDALIVNSADGRRWPSNLRRDPRFSMAIEEGETNVTLRGTVEIIDDQERAQADIAAMARLNYDPVTAEASIRDQYRREKRVSFRLLPARIHAELGED